MIVYKITNLVNDKVYVGQTINKLNKRVDKHFKSHGSVVLKAAVAKYGRENFKVEVIATASCRTHLNKLEIMFIKQLNTMTPHGYNIRSGGGAGHTCSDELKKVISERTKIAMACPIIREKISISKKGKPVTNGHAFKKGQQSRNISIYCEQTGVIYKNQLDAARDLGVCKAAINNHVNGKTKTCKNLTFKKVA